MTAAGFENVEIHEVAHTLPAMTTREAWAWMVRATAPVALLRQSLGPTKWASFETRVLARLIEAFGEEGQRMQRKANLSVGRKPKPLRLVPVACGGEGRDNRCL
jgi:hypothetical protein